jgi:hypothetical protein
VPSYTLLAIGRTPWHYRPHRTGSGISFLAFSHLSLSAISISDMGISSPAVCSWPQLQFTFSSSKDKEEHVGDLIMSPIICVKDNANAYTCPVEEIDTMYIIHVNPRESTKWVAPPPDQLITTEKLVRGASATGADVERTADPVAEPGTTVDDAK